MPVAASRREEPADRVVRAASWVRLASVVLAVLALLASTTLLRLDERNVLLVLATGLTPFLYLPAEVVLVLTPLHRRWGLALAAAALTALHVTWMYDGMLAHHGNPAGADGPTLSVLEANLFFQNGADSRLGRQLVRNGPDLVVLLEASDTSFAPLQAAGVLDAYPYRVLRLDPSSRGFAVLSRYPLTGTRVDVLNGNWPFLRATVLVGTRRLSLLTVHATSPLSDRTAWQEQLAWVARAAGALPEPVLVAGDFNATPFHRSYRRLRERSGLDDVVTRVGRHWPLSWQMTWPMTWPAPTGWPQHVPLPPVLQLDHVLVSGGVAVRSAGTVPLAGSDHRGIRTVVVLP
jgi:endonuclease/exonuclease/phosphatase (EEP) superfamily protein YafD